MDTTCYSCSKSYQVGRTVSRRDECPHCGRNTRCCRMCTFYDPNSYNECREPQAERVVDKEKSTMCDYFSLNPSPGSDHSSEKDEVLGQLDDLFK